MLRKWEHRYFLTTELVFKIVYAKLIEWATRATYTPNIEETEIVLNRLPPDEVHSLVTLDAVTTTVLRNNRWRTRNGGRYFRIPSSMDMKSS